MPNDTLVLPELELEVKRLFTDAELCNAQDFIHVVLGPGVSIEKRGPRRVAIVGLTLSQAFRLAFEADAHIRSKGGPGMLLAACAPAV